MRVIKPFNLAHIQHGYAMHRKHSPCHVAKGKNSLKKFEYSYLARKSSRHYSVETWWTGRETSVMKR